MFKNDLVTERNTVVNFLAQFLCSFWRTGSVSQ